jgi:hypothetical protein
MENNMPEKLITSFKSIISFASILAIGGLIASQAVTNFKASDTTIKLEKHCTEEAIKEKSLTETLSNMNTNIAVQTKQMEILTHEVMLLREKKEN